MRQRYSTHASFWQWKLAVSSWQTRNMALVGCCTYWHQNTIHLWQELYTFWEGEYPSHLSPTSISTSSSHVHYIVTLDLLSCKALEIATYEVEYYISQMRSKHWNTDDKTSTANQYYLRQYLQRPQTSTLPKSCFDLTTWTEFMRKHYIPAKIWTESWNKIWTLHGANVEKLDTEM